MGRLIVIEGLDGSGKATQTKLLAQRLLLRGQQVQCVSYPNYGSPSSALVRMYLQGAFGSSPHSVNAYAASAFYAVDRFAGFMQDWAGFYAQGGTVLADRYATSNAIHQCAKLPRGQWQAFITWLEDFEYDKLQIPKPDLVLYLDVEPRLSQKLLEQRYAEAGGKDIHESDFTYLLQCRKAAHWCAKRLGWRLVPCSQSGNMRAAQDITGQLESIIYGEDI